MDKHILSEIWIYPIKSLGGISLSSARVMEKGLRHDRRWMLVDENNGFMTQRGYPRMSLFKMTLEEQSIRISYEEDVIQLPLETLVADIPFRTHIWNDLVEVVEVPGEFSRWFSKRLGTVCKLVAFPEESPRPVDPQYRLRKENVSLADGYPVLIIGQASLDDLNRQLETPVPMNRFRPNLVFRGGQPYEEDTWKEFSVGSNRFKAVKPCSRCVITTVNQETGEKGREPLATLSRYRKSGENIYFGENAIPIDYHEIYEGDEIILH